MKKLHSLLCILALLANTSLFAQTKKASVKTKVTAPSPTPVETEKGALFFEKTYIDLGAITDRVEPIKVVFKFKNIGKGNVKILNVKPDCNCSRPQWAKTEVPFGQEGEIITYFYPEGISGDVTKTLTVFSTGMPDVTYLQLRVYVNDVNARITKTYPNQQGQLKFDTYEVKFPKLFDYSIDSVFRVVFNPTKKPIQILKIKTPEYIRVTYDNSTIFPDNNMTFKFKYFAAQAKDYGTKLDEVLVYTNDSLEPIKKYLVRANIEEDFSLLTPKELKNAPVFSAITPVVNLDTVDIKSTNTAIFTVTNKGKTPMYLRKVYGSCGCTNVEWDKNQPIKKGKKATIKVTYNSNYDLGLVEKQIFVITNTPNQTLHELTLKANIVYRKK